jgi:dTDP-4-dehydrorhamnose 3,5-epimerase
VIVNLQTTTTKRTEKPLKIANCELAGVKICEPSMFEDYRGEYVNIFEERRFLERFVEDDISVSRKGVLRGIHGDDHTGKLITCLYGAFYLAVVNWDKDSPEYKKWIGITLSDKNRLLVYVPPKFGNGHLVLTDMAIFHYKQTAYYNREGQFTIKWDSLGIKWPMNPQIISERDSNVS